MAQRTNPPRRVRQKFAATASSTSTSTSRASDEDYFQLRHRTRAGQNQLPAKKLLLCLDYGTSLTSMSYAILDPEDVPTDFDPSAIKCIVNWPGASQFSHSDIPFVPSESWYGDGRFLWGYEVQNTLRKVSEDERTQWMKGIVQLPKLLLDNDMEDLDEDQLALPREALRNVGRTATEAIRDYLMKAFKHAHNQLVGKKGFNDSWQVELALCVPSKWSTYAHLTMQEIILEVVNSTDMRGREFSLFIIDEPEAAVTLALTDETTRRIIKEVSTFIVCDAGGGTVDAITYRVRQQDPFRFDEIATPAGKDCGSCYINQAFINDTRQRLAHITELGRNRTYGKESVLHDDLFRPFENDLKRNYNPVDWEGETSRDLRVFGLEEDSTRNFGDGIMFITKDQMNNYFRRSLEGTKALIREQLKQLDGQVVKAILLLGGFSKSPALRRCLNNAFGSDQLRLIYLNQDTDITTTAVSRGGVLRALNKESGPRRRIRLNLGVCLSEPYDERFKGHSQAPYVKNPLNGKRYVEDCMDWVIRKGRILNEGKSAEICLHRTFRPDEEMTACETIYFSDQRVFQHYRRDHPKNRGHRKAGVVEASLEVLRRNNMLEEKFTEDLDVYHEVHYSIRLEVNGLNIKATIHCPPGEEVQGQAQICIAAAFSPGTN